MQVTATKGAAGRAPEAVGGRLRATGVLLVRWLLLWCLVAVSFGVGLAGAFMHRWVSPLGMVLAIGAAAGVSVLARHAARSRLGVGAVALAWLVAVLMLAQPRPGGDVVIAGDADGLTFLFGGAVATAVAVGLGSGRVPGRQDHITEHAKADDSSGVQ